MRDKLGRFIKGHTVNVGRKHSEETKEKIGETHTGSKNPMYGRTGKNHPRWKGGKMISNGYILILKPKHPFAMKSGYVKRSRLVMEKKLGRYLLPEEVVHHKGIHFPIDSIKNKQDDRPDNLQLFPNRNEHTKFHHSKGSKFGINKK